MKNLIKPDLSDDNVLLQQIEQGNKHAFDVVYKKYWQSAFASAYKRIKDVDQAKDIVQEIFIHIWLKRESLHIENIPAYLHTAVRNRVFKLLEKQKITHPFFDLLENIPTTYSQADASLLQKDFMAAYEALLKTLPPKRELIFRLRYQEDISTIDIAKQLGLSRKTVQNQIGKALEQIKTSVIDLFIVLIIISLGR